MFLIFRFSSFMKTRGEMGFQGRFLFLFNRKNFEHVYLYLKVLHFRRVFHFIEMSLELLKRNFSFFYQTTMSITSSGLLIYKYLGSYQG